VKKQSGCFLSRDNRKQDIQAAKNMTVPEALGRFG